MNVDTPRILLTGPQWFADLLAFCERGLQETGALVRVIDTNTAPWLQKARAKRDNSGHIRFVGPQISARLDNKIRHRLQTEIRDQVVQALKEWKPDAVVSLLCWGDAILGSGEVLADAKIPTVGWLMDDPFHGDGSLANICTAFSHIYAVDGSWTDIIHLSTGKPADLLPCGADFTSTHPVPSSEIAQRFHADVAFVGTSYHRQAPGLMRKVLLESVADQNLAIWGDESWRNVSTQLAPKYRGGPLGSVETNLAYNGAKIAVNIHHPQFRAGTSLRTFAIAAAGAFQLIDWRPRLDEFYEPGVEIATYRSPEEFRELTLRYLKDEKSRQNIAQAALERTQQEHTYAHRMKTILGNCGLATSGVTIPVNATFASAPSSDSSAVNVS